MIIRLIFTAIIIVSIIVGFSGSAYAADCPAEIKKVDAALAGASLLPSQAQTVKTIRDMASRLNQAGRDQDCLKAIGHAKTLLSNMGASVK